MDVICCVNGGEPPQPRNFWKSKFGGGYYRAIRSFPCTIIVGIVSLGLLGLAVAGILNVPVGLNEQVSMEVNSDLFNYFTYQKKYIEVGPPAYLVFNNFDYRNETHKEYISTLNN
jgi:Niemann-Pick C1 protein